MPPESEEQEPETAEETEQAEEAETVEEVETVEETEQPEKTVEVVEEETVVEVPTSEPEAQSGNVISFKQKIDEILSSFLSAARSFSAKRSLPSSSAGGTSFSSS